MERDTISTHTVRRGGIVLLIVGLVFSILLLRVVLFQTVDFERYQEKVLSQMTTKTTLPADRGTIYDRNGKVLATNVTTYRVFISPNGISKAQKELDRKLADKEIKKEEYVEYKTVISDGLSEILGVGKDTVLRQIGMTNYLDRTIKKDVPEETAYKVRELIAEYSLEDMIYLEATSTRYYPYGSLAAQTIGFTGSDGSGLYGLELQYNEVLAGVNGSYITARDSSGAEMPYEYEKYVAAIDGLDLTTTIDAFIQAALDEQVAAAYIESAGQNRACGLAIDVNTGAILGISTYPSFDLNDAWTLDTDSKQKLESAGLDPTSDEYYALQAELRQIMWSNKAVTEVYIPGSTFKPITAAIALEENAVDLSHIFNCPGYYTILGVRIRCHKTHGHGNLNFAEGLQQSCNPILMTVGQSIGREAFYQYFESFGYLEKTGIDFPGEGNSIFYEEDSFSLINLATASFGQNFKVSLLQHMTAISAVANGGYLVTPYLVEEIGDGKGNVVYRHETEIRRQVISNATSEKICEILEEGVSGNGGAKNAYVMGYKIAAKTGTSEKIGDGDGSAYICSCLAFAPSDDAKIAVIIMVDEPTEGSLYGSTVAAPYIAKFMEAVLPYLGVEAEYTEKELEKMAVKVSNYRGWSVRKATEYANNDGLEVTVIGSGSVVTAQIPAAGSYVEKISGRILLYTDGETPPSDIEVPDVVGKTAVAANALIVGNGLNIKIEGTKNYLSGKGATVIEQSPAAGTRVPEGTVVTVTFRYLDDEDFVDDDVIGELFPDAAESG